MNVSTLHGILFLIFLNISTREINKLQFTLENLNTQSLKLFDSSNKFLSPWTLRTSLGKKARYLEYLGRSNKIVGPFDGFLWFSQTIDIAFRPKFKSSNVRFFGKIIHHNSLCVFVRCFLEKKFSWTSFKISHCSVRMGMKSGLLLWE